MSESARHEISLTINGSVHQLNVESRQTLVEVLRDELGLTGTHTGCEHGVCGSCTVSVDGEPARSCLMLAVQADGAVVETVEGLSPDGELGPLPDAFRRCHSFQCAFCAPGFLMTAHCLLGRNPQPTREQVLEELSGNLCRCTGYQSILDGMAEAVVALSGGSSEETAGEETARA